MITVFTPAYNRAHTLPRLYQSLMQQAYDAFEWIIVDDGSVDGTEQLVNNWISEGKIIIRYMRVPNGGKSRAVNRGVALAHGELFLIVDSDDSLTDNALFSIDHVWQQIKSNATYAGIAGYCVTLSGELIGNSFSEEYLDTDAISFRYKYGIQGDKAEIYRTDLLKQFPFPEIEGEKFVPEALMHFRIAEDHNIRWINQPFMVRDYQPGGLTANIVRLFKQNPKAYDLYYSELLDSCRLGFKHYLIVLVKYVRQCFHAEKQIADFVSLSLTYPFFIFMILPGWLYYLKESMR